MAIVKRYRSRTPRRQNNEGENRQETQPVSNPADDDDVPKSSSRNAEEKTNGKKPVKSKARGAGKSPLAKHPRGYAVKSSYSLRTGIKGAGLDVFPESEQHLTAFRKRKLLKDSESDSEEPCKRIKSETNYEADDDGGDDDFGNGGGEQGNLSSLGLGVVAGQ